jgi:hypothetical protein
MANPIPSGLQIGGKATAIVQALRVYGRDQPVPVGLVARAVGLEEDEIRASLTRLTEEGIITLDGDRVTLIK